MKISKSFSPCRKCGGYVFLKVSKFKKEKLNKPYYYTHIWHCSGCATIYMDDTFKVNNQKNQLIDKAIETTLLRNHEERIKKLEEIIQMFVKQNNKCG